MQDGLNSMWIAVTKNSRGKWTGPAGNKTKTADWAPQQPNASVRTVPAHSAWTTVEAHLTNRSAFSPVASTKCCNLNCPTTFNAPLLLTETQLTKQTTSKSPAETTLSSDRFDQFSTTDAFGKQTFKLGRFTHTSVNTWLLRSMKPRFLLANFDSVSRRPPRQWSEEKCPALACGCERRTHLGTRPNAPCSSGRRICLSSCGTAPPVTATCLGTSCVKSSRTAWTTWAVRPVLDVAHDTSAAKQ